MKKTKTTRRKVRGKNMKKLFACLLSLSMIPAVGTGVIVPAKQVKAASESSQETKNGFAQKEITTKIGQFDPIEFKNSDGRVILSVNEDSKNKINIYETYNGGDKEYRLEPQEEGDATITATFTSSSGETYDDTLTVHITKDDSLVPFKSYVIYKSVEIYHDDSEESWGETADVNHDNAISKEEIKKAESIDIQGGRYSESDLNYLSQIVDCKSLRIMYSNDIKNLDFAKTMTKLKIGQFIDLHNLSDISGLESSKDSFTYLQFAGTNVSAKDRFSFLRTKTIDMEAGTEKNVTIQPRGLILESDKYNLDPEDSISITQNEGDKNEFTLKDEDAKENDTITLTLKDSKETAEYPISINIVKQNEQTPDFEQTEKAVEIGTFEPIKVKDSEQLKSVEITSDDKSVVGVASAYTEKGEEVYYYVPREEGIATLTGRFKTKDGTIYKKKMQVKVAKSTDENIMPITSFDLYWNSCDEEGNHVDYNKDYKISKEEFSHVRAITCENDDFELSENDLNIIKQATACEELILRDVTNLKDIEFITNMPNLKYLDLEGNRELGDEQISVLDGLKLDYLNLEDTSVSFEKRMSFVDKSEIKVGAGEEIINLVKPEGIISYDDEVSVEDPSVATVERKYVEDDNGGEYKWVLTGKEGQEEKTTNILIKESDDEDAATIKIPVKVIEKIPVTSITLNKTELTLKEGKSEKLIATCKPDDATSKYVKWKSSDPDVAYVTTEGVVSGDNVGTAEITATTTNGLKATCKVTVTEAAGGDDNNKPSKPEEPTTEAPKPTTPENPTTEAPKPTTPTTQQPAQTTEAVKVSKISVTGISTNVAAGKKVKLTANITPSNASNKSVTWTTSNKKVATVNASGVVSVNKKAGGKTVTITAAAKDGSGKKATYKIKVMKGAVKKVKISGKKSVKAGKTLSLKAKVTASKGANKKLIWTSSNTKYATVSASGKVKASKAGKKKSVKITAMATDGSGKKATVTVKIK